MPRGPRNDAPGRLFHVMNRGIAKRTMFERRADFRFFLSRLASAVRRGEIDVLSFCLMLTHFHLIVRSHGHLSQAMQRIASEYTRRFNVSRGRKGALQCSRFLSKPVRSRIYLVNLVPYVDENPVKAGLVKRAEGYRWGSLGARARRRHRLWLCDDLTHLSRPIKSCEDWGERAWLVEARMAGQGEENPYEELVGANPDGVAEWMHQRARLADGTPACLPIVPRGVVSRAVDALFAERVDKRILVPSGRRMDMAELMLAGLLRELCGLRFTYIAQVVGTSAARARRCHKYHCRCVELLDGYRQDAARVVARCLRSLDLPGDVPPLV